MRNGKGFGCVFAVLAVLILAGAVCAVETYPTIVACTGTGVRLRADPSTTSRILGKADEGDWFIAVGETAVDGDVWYEVEHPTQKGTAWIFGKYVEEYLDESMRTPAFYTVVRVRQSFGNSPAKARVLFGKPRKETKRMFYVEMARRDFSEEVLVYSTHEARYVEGTLAEVVIREGTLPFGELRIGDPADKLIELLGEPQERGGDGWLYEVSPVEVLQFGVENGRVVTMRFERYLDA